jgi:hypothetical protein
MALIKDRYSLGFDFIIISRLNKHSFIQNSHIIIETDSKGFGNYFN